MLKMNRFLEWARQPVSSQMDMTSVVLTTVLVITIAFLWTHVLGHIVSAASE